MATTDLVMPKLGLTMTEGTVARWDVPPGGRFRAGDIIVVVETDKIAYDVEAPGPGILHEVLVAEGKAVPVGTPIGRLDVEDIGDTRGASDVPETPETKGHVDSPPAARVAAETLGVTSAAPPRLERERILATPFARRLARQAGIDLRRVNGTGPKGRIKAADVEQAATAGRFVSSPADDVAMHAQRAAVRAGVEIDIGALLAIKEEINGALPDADTDLAHYVVLAAARASDIFAAPPVIGLARERENGAGTVSLLAHSDCRTLGSVIAQIGSSSVAETSALHGTLWIERALDGVSFLSADPPSGWSASLVIGSMRNVFRPDAEGRPKRAALVDVVLTSRAAELDTASAQRLLLRIRQLLEAPLLLLAS